MDHTVRLRQQAFHALYNIAFSLRRNGRPIREENRQVFQRPLFVFWVIVLRLLELQHMARQRNHKIIPFFRIENALSRLYGLRRAGNRVQNCLCQHRLFGNDKLFSHFCKFLSPCYLSGNAHDSVKSIIRALHKFSIAPCLFFVCRQKKSPPPKGSGQRRFMLDAPKSMKAGFANPHRPQPVLR